MPLKAVIDTLDGLPEPVASEYEARDDGKFTLKIDGDTPALAEAKAQLGKVNAKLAEFRDNNIGLNQTLTEREREHREAMDRFKGIDPAEHKKLKKRAAELEDRGIKKSEDILEHITTAVSKAVSPLEEKISGLEKERDQANTALARRNLETDLLQAGVKAGLLDKAVPDFLSRGTATFRNIDGRTVAMDGDTPLFSKINASEPLTVAEWIGDLQREASHLFKASGGGGTTGSGDTSTGGERTFDAESDRGWLENLEDIADGKVVRQQ
jgi:hypothetical protein